MTSLEQVTGGALGDLDMMLEAKRELD